MGIGGQGISAVAQMALVAGDTVTGCDQSASATTTAMLALMLVDAGLDPTCEIGAVVPRFGVNYRIGKSQYFVNEADEFNHNFWHYHPRLAVVTSIEFEHPEFFANYEDFLAAFEHFVRGMDMDGDWPLPPTLVLNANSAGCVELLDRIKDWQGCVVTYAVEGFMTQKDINAASKEKKLTDFEGETVISMNS